MVLKKFPITEAIETGLKQKWNEKEKNGRPQTKHLLTVLV